MEPDFQLIGCLLEYRSVIRFLAGINIFSGFVAFLLEALRLPAVQIKALSLAYGGIWIGIAWIGTGIFAILASKSATRYSRLQGYVVVFLALGAFSGAVCLALLIQIAYLTPFVTELSHTEIYTIVILRSCMVVLCVVNFFTACCEITFGVCQFKSGYFRFVKQWSNPDNLPGLNRSSTDPVRRHVEENDNMPGTSRRLEVKDQQRPTRSASTKNKQSHAPARKTMSEPAQFR